MTERSPRMSAAHSSRHLARVFALLGLYQWLADPEQDYAAIEAHLAGLIEDEGEQIEGCDIRPSDFASCDRAFFRTLLAGVLDRMSEIEPLVAKTVDRDLSRVSLVERAVLFIGAFELLACPETPWRVILNESLELAKEFGSGYRFTNAVLEKIAHEVRPAEPAE